MDGGAAAEAREAASTANTEGLSFVPSRDLCNIKQLDANSSEGIRLAQDGIDKIAAALGVGGQDLCLHPAPQALDEATEDPDEAGRPDGDAEDSFELRHVRTWLSRLIAQLSKVAGGASEEDEAKSEALFDRASMLLSACAGKMASGPLTKLHRFGRPDLDIELPLRDGSLIHDSLGTHTWGAAPILTQLLLPLQPAPRRSIKVLELGAGTGLVGLALAQWLHSVEGGGDGSREHLVCSTDYHPTVMENLAHNAKINGWDEHGRRRDSAVRLEVKTLDWQAVHSEMSSSASSETTPAADAAYVSTAQTVSSLPQQTHQESWARGLESVKGAESNSFDVLIAADCIYDPEHPAWIRTVAQKHLRRTSEAQTEAAPSLHLMLPLRASHKREIQAIYEAFPLADEARSPVHGKDEPKLCVTAERDFVGYDDFGAPNLILSPTGIRDRRGGSANRSIYRWIQVEWR